MATSAPYKNQEVLFSALLHRWKLKNYYQLARVLGVAPPALSKMRNGRIPIGPTMILAIHEEDTSLSIKQLKELIYGKDEFHTPASGNETSGNTSSTGSETA
jgi:plasmid maintenance system antidote protein VapI